MRPWKSWWDQQRIQNGGIPAAAAAFSIGTANPMPMKVPCSPGFKIAVTMPTTLPSIVTSGPPELPGLAAASNWIRLVSRSPSGERNCRFRPETTPPDADGPMPKGKRIALRRVAHGSIDVFLGQPRGKRKQRVLAGCAERDEQHGREGPQGPRMAPREGAQPRPACRCCGG